MTKVLLSFLIFFIFIGCFEPEPDTKLKNTFWSLSYLQNDNPISHPGKPEVHLIFHINDNTINGSDGCNKIAAKYTLEKNHIKIYDLISTRMYCENIMEQSNKFLDALKKVDTLTINGTELILYDDSIELASFQASQY